MDKILYFFILIELFVVSFGDFRTRKIPNAWSILNLCLFITFLILLPHYYPFRFDTFLYSLVFLGVGFIFFLMRIMGAGDTKFLFSFFLLVPFKIQSTMLDNLLLCTVYIGITFFLYNLMKNFKNIYLTLSSGYLVGLSRYFGSKFPYAPVILVSWMITGYDIKIWK